MAAGSSGEAAAPGEPFGRFQLFGRIASGGMASVYLGRDPGRERWVAIKRVHPHLATRPEVVRMFLNEARLLSRLAHDNICTILDFGIERDAPYIAMRYLHGAPLSTLLKRLIDQHEPIPVDLMAHVAASVCAGLHYAHEAAGDDGRSLGLVHRDISPQNIFITFEGGVQLLDFGVAKASGFTGYTRTGHIKGKYAYMSPEQVEALGLDRRSDLFSLGIVLWESLAARHLFRRKRHIDTLRAITAAPVPPAVQFNAEVPRQLDLILQRALQRDRAKRYQSALLMGDELRAYLANRPVKVGSAELAAAMLALFPEKKHPGETHGMITQPEALGLQTEPEVDAPLEDGELDDEEQLDVTLPIQDWPRMRPEIAALEATSPGAAVPVAWDEAPPETQLDMQIAPEASVPPQLDDTEMIAGGFRELLDDPLEVTAAAPGGATTRETPLDPAGADEADEEQDRTVQMEPKPQLDPLATLTDAPLSAAERLSLSSESLLEESDPGPTLVRAPESTPPAPSPRAQSATLEPFKPRPISRLTATPADPATNAHQQAVLQERPQRVWPLAIAAGLVAIGLASWAIGARGRRMEQRSADAHPARTSTVPEPPRVEAVRPSATPSKPSETEVLERQGREALFSGDFKTAESALLECVRRAPDAACYRSLGVLYAQRDEPDLSRDAYLQYLRLSPEGADAARIRAMLAEVEAKKNGRDRRRPEGRGAQRASDEAKRALFAGDLSRAERQLLECLKLGGVPECHRSLGILYARRGDPRRAVEHYQRYLELSPSAPDAEALREMLRGTAPR